MRISDWSSDVCSSDLPSVLIYFDLNGLKEINDKEGHGAGDAALIQVGQILLDNTRESDIVARLGGDEYGVILSETDAQQGREKADHLAEAIRRRPLHWEGKVLQLDAAYGVYPLKDRKSTRLNSSH